MRTAGLTPVATTCPTPLSATSCGASVAVSVTVIVAVRTPAAVGVKATQIVHVSPEASAVPVTQPPDGGKDSAKSEVLVPVTVGVARMPTPPPVAVKVTVWVGLVVPTVWTAKDVPVTFGGRVWAGRTSAGRVVASELGAATTSRPELSRARARMRAMNPVVAR